MERRALVDLGLRPGVSAAYLIFESPLHTFVCAWLLAVTKPQNAEPLKIRETREIARMIRKGIP
jgi:hypothetical protein